MKQKHLVFTLVAAWLLASCTKQINEPATTEASSTAGLIAADVEQAAPARTPHRPYVPNEVLVKFKITAPANARFNALAHVSGAVREKILTKAMQAVGDNEGFVVVHTPLAVLDAINKLRGGIDIVYAEPNYIYTHEVMSTDSYFKGGSLWGMYGDASAPKNSFGSQAAEAWAVGHTGSKNVYVGIIDEGMQYTHPDLSGRIWTNPYDKVDGIDNDGNGYIDDVHGWDFANNNKSVYDGGTSGTKDNHGTHVAGTIGAKSNATGVVGMDWYVTIIACKFLNPDGGTTSDAVKAIDYLTDMKKRHGLKIVASNNSWGGGEYSQAMYDAIQRANNNNILFVAAAGNGGDDQVGDNIDISPSYPASYKNSNVISVAAITSSGGKASYSNYGAASVDIGAPGSGIWSTTAFNTYSNYSGTSMATPHVTGAVALYASTHTTASAATIKAAILNNAMPTASLKGKCVTGGRLNVSKF